MIAAEQAIPTTMLSKILPTTVVAVEQTGVFTGTLLDEEAALLGPNVVPLRRAEFAAGRTCAREALRVLGFAGQPVLRGENRQPLWPNGVVGSITHCDGYCAAAVARADDMLTIGIDAEKNQSLPEHVLEAIAFGEELEWLRRSPQNGICWDKLLFSMKEAVYKAWYPRERRWLDFDQVGIAPDVEENTFQARISGTFSSPVLSGQIYRGRYLVAQSLILTAVCIPTAAVATRRDGIDASRPNPLSI